MNVNISIAVKFLTLNCYARVYVKLRCPDNLRSSYVTEEKIFAYSENIEKSPQLGIAGHPYAESIWFLRRGCSDWLGLKGWG